MKIFHDEIAEDKRIFNARKKFMIETYLVCLGFMINSTSKIFENLYNVGSNFSVLDPKHLDNAYNVCKLKS